MNKLDKQYQSLLQDIINNGIKKQDRTGTGTTSVFGRQIRHKMSEGFPLLTTKKMPFKTIVTELLWFLQGNTNIKWLVDNGCNIWNGDAYKNYVSKESTDNSKLIYTQEAFINKIKTDDMFAKKWGELGPIYGKQWRSWSKFKEHKDAFEVDILEENEDSVSFTMGTSGMIYEIDQIQNLINDLKTNPDSRRLMVNAWNVGELDQMVLPPCHYGFQVYTRELSLEEREEILIERFSRMTVPPIFSQTSISDDLKNNNIPTRAISLMWNQRSVDTFLGLPFNITSYGLLLEIIAKEVNMIPDELIGNLGDVHLYSNHIEQAKEQIGRYFTIEERTEVLKQAMGEEAFQIAFDQQVPFGGRLSEYFGKYRIRPNLHTREPFPLPTLKFNPCPITGIDMEYQSIAQFEIENYQSHPAIKAPLSN